MINIAVMGFGVVGSGVVELLDKNETMFEKKIKDNVKCKYILDIRDFPESKYRDIVTHDFNDILNDDSVSVVCETIGGAGIAYDFTRKLLEAGKNVVTSNKELVAKHGYELLRIAKEKNVFYLFEAAVGGGIPILNPLYNCLSANRIKKICGILNGTTNYILTKMYRDGISFELALKQAQELGYAEKDPTADIEGFDSCRKICILADIAWGRHIDPDSVKTTGISCITADDIRRADKNGKTIKLIGSAEITDNGDIEIFVGPCEIDRDSHLSNINDVYNGITVIGDAVGSCTFIGSGAGKMPTASAVCGDIIECMTVSDKRRFSWNNSGDQSFVRSFDKLTVQKDNVNRNIYLI